MAVIRNLCHRCILLDIGKIKEDNDTKHVVGKYISTFQNQSVRHKVNLVSHNNRLKGMHQVLTEVCLRDINMCPTHTFSQSDEIIIEISYDGRNLGEPIAGAGIILEDSTGVRIGGYNTYMSSLPPHRLPLIGKVRFHLKAPKLIAGRYLVTASIGPHQHSLSDKVEKAATFDVIPEDIYGTGFLLTPSLGSVVLECESEVIEISRG
jgi:hypothetical protein